MSICLPKSVQLVDSSVPFPEGTFHFNSVTLFDPFRLNLGCPNIVISKKNLATVADLLFEQMRHSVCVFRQIRLLFALRRRKLSGIS